MTQIFDHIHISSYRGLENIDLPQLGRVNIFMGNNNSGKTSLLEVVSILCNPLDPFQWLEISQRRLYLGRMLVVRPDLEAIKWIFPQKEFHIDEHYQAEISVSSSGNTPITELRAVLKDIYGVGLGKSGEEKFNDESVSSEDEAEAVSAGVELEVTARIIPEQKNLFAEHEAEHQQEAFQFWEGERFIQRRRNKPLVKNATIFPSYSASEPILSRLSRIILREEDGKNEILDLIRLLDVNIIDIHILSTPRANLYIEHKEIGFAPLYVFGDGFKRALVMALTLLTTDNGVLLIDEIETSIHVSALSNIFSWLIEACHRLGIQIFATTHSLEAIDAMFHPEINVDNIVAFRLNSKGQPPQRFSGDLLHRLRSERGLDVR